MEKVNQMTTIYAKRPYIIPNGHILYQTAFKYTNIFHSKALQNIPKFGFFGLKINHLATLTTSFPEIAIDASEGGNSPQKNAFDEKCAKVTRSPGANTMKPL
jgi:hypothetical protein